MSAMNPDKKLFMHQLFNLYVVAQDINWDGEFVDRVNAISLCHLIARDIERAAPSRQRPAELPGCPRIGDRGAGAAKGRAVGGSSIRRPSRTLGDGLAGCDGVL